jgi:holliday junction DNA helicase RuvA
MIASLRGVLAEKGPGHCVVETSGVGYWVTVSGRTARSLPEAGEPVFLHTHQVVREDALQLYGFTDLEERRLFEMLITVSGVGPKVAIAVLSGLAPAALARAIREENLAQLTGISGVGRKTAERLVVELRDKLELAITAASSEPQGADAMPSKRGVLPKSERFEDAVAALVRLGYSQAQAQDVVRKVAGAEGDLSLEALVRQSLARLSKTTAGVR